MRPVIAIFCLILGGVLLAALVSLRTPHPDPLPGDAPIARPADPGKPATPAAKAPADTDPAALAKFDKLKATSVRASLEIEGRGVIEMELYPTAAPKTVAHLADLSSKSFWDGVKIHRVDNLVVQMGDPSSKGADPTQFTELGIGSHGSGSTVPLEVDQKLSNLKYTIGLARTDEKDSGDSQFFINLNDNPGFDYDYCVFGRITKGSEIVSKLAIGDVIRHFQVYEAGKK